MGGFHIYSSGPKRPLRPSYLEEVIGMVERGSIELPSLEEIDEKSKSRGGGGLLIKAVVLLQASWFLVQCLARTITPSEFNSQTQTMRISRLEILTIAYIMMAFCMYLAWWDKPLNVNRPIPLPRTMGFQFSPFSRPTRFHTVSSFRVMLGWYHQDFVQRVKDIVSGFEAENGTRDTHVPRFYGGRRYNNKVGLSLICVCLLASAFAGINCIAWSYESSTLIELGLWRLASIAGIAFFLHIPVTFLFLDAVWEHWHRMPYSTFLAWTTILWAVIYVFFRVTSIVIAIRELNAAPTQLGIYEAIPWVELIPHV